jgi:hypothetical protein
MAEKSETVIPKSSMSKDTIIGDYRFQYYKEKDEIHVHDDDSKLVFVFKNGRQFQLGVDDFVRNSWRYKDQDTVVISGERNHSSSGGKIADLVLTKEGNRWVLTLAPSGSVVGKYIVADKTLVQLDDFINRNI